MNLRKISKMEETKKSKSSLEILRSNFVFKKILIYMKKNKILDIMKYNKRLQKRLNLNINDYKEYSKLYSSIEIELKLVDNKYGEFINIPDDDNEYYHIYFDNSNEEIKRNYLIKTDKVKIIKIIIDYQVKSFKKLFYNCKCISSIIFKKFFRFNIPYSIFLYPHLIVPPQKNFFNSKK